MEVSQGETKRIRLDPATSIAGDEDTDDCNNPLDQLDILRHVVSFLNPVEMCSWDLTCKEYCSAGKHQWGNLASIRFGISQESEKEGWKLGVSLMKKPILVEFQDSEDFGNGSGGLSGTPCIATNQSLLVMVSDDADSNKGPDRNFPIGFNGISIRDAGSLNYFRTVSSPITNWRVAICGREGCEILITCNFFQFCAIRGSVQLDWKVFPSEDCDTWSGGLSMLGCETHLITFECNKIHLYDVDVAGGSLVEHKMSMPISNDLRGNQDHKSSSLMVDQFLQWSNCRKYFSFFEPNTECMCIWKFEMNEGLIHPVRNISTTFDIKGTVLSDNYIVGTDYFKTISVWDRKTGELCHEGLCDVSIYEEEDSDREDSIYPLSMTVVNGDLMVSSSSEGNACCIWNLRDGKLLNRYTNSFDEGIDDTVLDDGSDVTSIVYLKALNSFIFSCGCHISTWAFPISKITERKIMSVRRRERNITRVYLGFRQG